MIHLGTPEFCAFVQSQTSASVVVIHEGVDSPIVRRITRSYCWIRPERLGLVVQPKVDFFGSDASLRSGDLASEDFDERWRTLPMALGSTFEVAAAGVGLWSRAFGRHDRIGRSAATDLLFEHRDYMMWSPKKPWLLDVILDVRDDRLWAVLQNELGCATGKPSGIAVMWRALHMRSLVQRLYAFPGFPTVASVWIKIYPA